jgi:hypothetical protein
MRQLPVLTAWGDSVLERDMSLTQQPNLLIPFLRPAVWHEQLSVWCSSYNNPCECGMQWAGRLQVSDPSRSRPATLGL